MSMSKIIFGLLTIIAFGAIAANAFDQSAICSSGANMVLYPNGALQSCVLKDVFSANDIKCKSQGQVSFYDNGRLEACVLAEPATISGQTCKEYEFISFYPDGKFKACVKKD